MATVTVTRPSEHALSELGIKNWSIWTSEVKQFDWHYDDRETCYFVEGEVCVTIGGEQVTLKEGDLAIFPKGSDTVWDVRRPVKKYYKLG